MDRNINKSTIRISFFLAIILTSEEHDGEDNGINDDDDDEEEETESNRPKNKETAKRLLSLRILFLRHQSHEIEPTR